VIGYVWYLVPSNQRRVLVCLGGLAWRVELYESGTARLRLELME
jgi:hypothetical protein